MKGTEKPRDDDVTSQRGALKQQRWNPRDGPATATHRTASLRQNYLTGRRHTIRAGQNQGCACVAEKGRLARRRLKLVKGFRQTIRGDDPGRRNLKRPRLKRRQFMSLRELGRAGEKTEGSEAPASRPWRAIGETGRRLGKEDQSEANNLTGRIAQRKNWRVSITSRKTRQRTATRLPVKLVQG